MTQLLNLPAPHWSKAWPEIAARILTAPRLLVGCDFDGTLTPIVGDPDHAVLLPAALDSLCRLRRAPGVTIAILSGRSLDDIMRRIPFKDVVFAGNHGLEMRGLGLDGVRPQAVALAPRLQVLAQKLHGFLGRIAGIRIENKELSLSVHYRNVAEAQWNVVFRMARLVASGDSSFKIQHGHMVLEFIPDVRWDKGAAFKQIAARLGVDDAGVFYAGDDITDESVFNAFPNATTLCVGAPRHSAAQWLACDPVDVCHFLEWLADARS